MAGRTALVRVTRMQKKAPSGFPDGALGGLTYSPFCLRLRDQMRV
jgi:hypothetical protein